MTTLRHSPPTAAVALVALCAALAALALTLTDGSRADAPPSVSLLARQQVPSDIEGLPTGEPLGNLSAGMPSVNFADARRVLTKDGALWAARGGDGACIAAQSAAASQPWGAVCGPTQTLDSTGLFMLLDAGDKPAPGTPPHEVRVLGLVADDVAKVQITTWRGEQNTVTPSQSTVDLDSVDAVRAITVVRDDGTTMTIDLSEGN